LQLQQPCLISSALYPSRKLYLQKNLASMPFSQIKKPLPLPIHDLEERFSETFRRKSTLELISAWLIYRISSMKLVIRNTPAFLNWTEKYHISAPVFFFIRNTFFKHFCGGESAKDVIPCMQQLVKSNTNSILDLSIEADLGERFIEEQHSQVAQLLMECIHTAATVPGSFIAIKITSLCSPNQLEALSKGIEKVSHAFVASSITRDRFGSIEKKEFEQMMHLLFCNTITSDVIDRWFARADTNNDGKLNYIDCILLFYPNELLRDNREFFQKLYKDVNITMMQQTMNYLDQIGKTAASCKVRVMVDAEKTFCQPAIDYFVHEMQRMFNQLEYSVNGAPLIMNTHQMYLKSAIDTLQMDIQRAEQAGYFFATKLVRGAYLYSERQYAKEHGLADPIHKTKEETDFAYHQGIDILLNKILKEKDSAITNSGGTSFVIASHNPFTVLFGMECIHAKGLPSKSPLIGFAQLLGMSDYLSVILAEHSFNVFKYLPYGPVREVVPYLLRRAQENSDVLSSTYKDRFYVQRSLFERFSLLKKPKALHSLTPSDL
jgi:proline dehydrogenase